MIGGRFRRGWLGSLAAGWLVCAAPTMASAQSEEAPYTSERDEAKRLFAEGNARLKAKDFDGAITKYQQAHARLPHALIRYNLGIAYNRKGDPVKALATMKHALAETPPLSDERRKRAQQIVTDSARLVVRVKIVANVEGAEVVVDGEVVGTTPNVELPVASGRPVLVEARKKGFMPVSQVLKASGGTQQELRIELDATELLPAEVRVETKLPGAEVYLDGRLVAVTPLRSTLAVKPNETHRLELRRSGYETAVETLKLAPGTETTVKLDPAVDPDGASAAVPVTFDLRPADASVRVDGKLMERRQVRLVRGPHRVTVERTGYETASYDLQVSQATSVSYSLVPTTETRQAMIDSAASYQSWGYGLAIGGTVVGATGVALIVFNEGYFYDRSERELGEFDGDACRIAAGTDTAALDACTDRSAELLGRVDTARALRVAAPIVATVGVAAATTGLVMLITGDDPASFQLDGGDELGTLTLSPITQAGPTGGFFGLQGTF